MALQIFGIKKCKKTAKAMRFFKERGVAFHFINLAEKGISRGELESVIRATGTEDLIDTDSMIYKTRGMAYMEFDPVEEILENPLLVNMPVVRDGKVSVLGEKPEQWKGFLHA